MSISAGSPQTHDTLALAESHRYNARYENAFQILDTALKSPEFTPADLNLIRLRKLDYQIEHGWLHNRLLMDFADLKTRLGQAFDDADSRADERQYALATFLLGRLHYFHLFEADSPVPDFVETNLHTAYLLYQELEDERGMAESLFYRGLLYQIFKPNLDEAMRYFQRAYQEIEGKNHLLEESYYIRHIGFIHQMRGELDKARECQIQSVALRETVGFKVFLPLALLALGDVEIELGNMDEAATHFERAYAIVQEAPPDNRQVFVLLSLGELYEKKGDAARARDYFQQAHDTAQQVNSQRGLKMATAKLAAPIS